jgi:broad specificity phosphatase PhoE
MHHESTDRCVMFLLRHGATASNVASPPVLQGRGMNLSLSDQGRRQAQEAAAFFAGQRLTAIYSSPLVRALETARAIALPFGHDVTVVDELIEVDVGRWEGRSWVEIAQTEPDAYRRFMDDPGQTPYLGGESFQQVQDRALPALRRLMEMNPGGRIAVVAHNIVNRASLAPLLSLPTARARQIHQDNCGVNVVWLEGGEMKLRTLNSTFHLSQSPT